MNTSEFRRNKYEIIIYKELPAPDCASITLIDRGYDPLFDPGLDGAGNPQPLGGVSPDFKPDKDNVINIIITDKELFDIDPDAAPAGVKYFDALEKAAEQKFNMLQKDSSSLTNIINQATEAQKNINKYKEQLDDLSENIERKQQEFNDKISSLNSDFESKKQEFNNEINKLDILLKKKQSELEKTSK